MGKENYEDSTLNMSEMDGSDIKINPDFYIHFGILKAQTALQENNTKEGFVKYVIIVEHIESLCKSARYMPKDYEEKVAAIGETVTDENELVRNVRIANKKLEFLLTYVFSHKVSTANLTDRPNN